MTTIKADPDGIDTEDAESERPDGRSRQELGRLRVTRNAKAFRSGQPVEQKVAR
jgi:hypothetical protein